MKNDVALITLFVVISAGIFLSGCVTEKISAANDINLSISLMNSAETRIETIDLGAGGYSDAKVELNTSKVEFEKALFVLNNASTDYDEEAKIIETNKLICSYFLDYIEAKQNVIISLEHIDQSVAHLENNDFILAESELREAEEALNVSIPLMYNAKDKNSGIDLDILPVESKSEILDDTMKIDQDDKMISEMLEIISGMYSYIDGWKHTYEAINSMNNALDYNKREEWKKAEFEFNKSYLAFIKSKNIIPELKDSEFTEISFKAIEIDVFLTKMIEASTHFEVGCRYANEGNDYKAIQEFKKAPEFYQELNE